MVSEKKNRINEIIERLKAEYPDAHIALHHANAFELLIATILSAQCTDERVNAVTESLFRKYPHPKNFAEAAVEELERDVYSTGFYKNKARNIQNASKKIVEIYGGKIPSTMDELLSLDGVARKTANVVLGNAFGIASGIVVDTHVSRVSQRLVLTENSAPEKIEKDLNELVPQQYWIIFPHWLIAHGRKICQARKPQCDKCVLENLCPSSLLRQNA